MRVHKELKTGQYSLLNRDLYPAKESQKNYYNDRALLGRAAFKEWRLSLLKAEKETGLKIG